MIVPLGRGCGALQESRSQMTVASLAEADGILVPGDIGLVVTEGFRRPGDGGGARYRLATREDAPSSGRGITWFADRLGRPWRISEQVVHSRQVGSLGDGVSDDTRALRHLLQLGGSLRLSQTDRFYRISDEIEVPSGVVLEGIGNPLVRQTVPGKRAFVGLNRTNVTMRGWRLAGAGAALPFTSGPDDGLINFTADSPGAGADIRIVELEVFDAYSLVAITRCDRVTVVRCRLHRWMLYGALMSSSRGGRCEENIFHDCLQRGAFNAYACSATGNVAAGFPQQDFSFSRNQVSGVPSWDAFMTHQTFGLKVADNRIRDCRTGIDVTTEDEPITQVVITGNDITLTDVDTWSGRAAHHSGIAVHAEGAATQVADVFVADNIVRNANQAAGLTPSGAARGAFSFNNVRDLRLVRNRSLGQGRAAPSYWGIAIYRPRGATTIASTVIEGALDDNAIVIAQEPSGTAADIVIDDLEYRSSGRGRRAIRLHNGAYRRLEVRRAGRNSRDAAPELTGNAVISDSSAR